MLPAQPAEDSYTALASNIAVVTANSHILQLMSDNTNYTRVSRIRIQQTGVANAAVTVKFQIIRLTTAGTGGSAVTPRPHDEADTFAGAAMTLPSSKGTEGEVLDEIWLGMVAAAPFTNDNKAIWTPAPWAKPIIIDTATSDGLAIKNITSDSAGDVSVSVDFFTTSYL